MGMLFSSRGWFSDRSDLRLPRLFNSAEQLIDKSRFFHFIDKAQIDEVFRFRFCGAWIGERLDLQGLSESLECWIGIFDQKVYIRCICGIEYRAARSASVLLRDLYRRFFIISVIPAGLGERPDDPANLVGIF